MTITIPISELVEIKEHADRPYLKVDVVYAQAAHPENMFKQSVYRDNAPFILHQSFAELVLKAAQNLWQNHRLISVLKDGLRPIEAQQAMQETDIAKQNPHWFEDGPKRLLSPPGRGAHPRGMAVDIVLLDENLVPLDMGTPFDYLTPDPSNNPAARDYPHLSDAVKRNRALLDDAMMKAAKQLGLPLIPLPLEWWDFRYTGEFYNQYEPISDSELPPHLKMMP
jgi:D-alanyl-D-alanine dipeptidase